MMTNTSHVKADAAVTSKAEKLFAASCRDLHITTDRIFGWLMLLQWAAAIGFAAWLSPKAWAGVNSSIHAHLWGAIMLGGCIVALPIYFAWQRPGQTITRHIIAVGQMLMGALLIDLTGGRIETHFHVFGSLAFLAMYRDWKVLVTASTVVAADHFIRGTWWPLSVFGVLEASPWRWIEHAGWVVFEDIVLIYACIRAMREMRESALRLAKLEMTNETIENTVASRTSELHQTLAALDAANAAKSEFVANMSHEIRTPMTAILGFADLLMDPHQSPSDRLDCVQTIRRNSAHLLGIINDILDISKIEAGKMTVERIATSPVHIAADVASLMRGRAIERGLAFDVEYAGRIPASIQTDPVRLRQILVNLCGNAVKFTEQGSVRLRMRLELDATATGEAYLWFDVIDTGVGMTEEQLARIFRPFTQADMSTTRRFGGTGLGLTISRRLAGMLGGELSVQTRTREGSTFSLKLAVGPAANLTLIDPVHEAGLLPSPEDVTPAATDGKLLDGRRILLAEDGPDNQRLISFLLHKAGAAVTLAENGQIAVDTVMTRQKTGEPPFDVILMDMQMPEMDGYSATSLLRAKGYEGTIIALTAHAMAGDRERCLNAGCDEYLTKPITKAALMAMLTEVFRAGDLARDAA